MNTTPHATPATATTPSTSTSSSNSPAATPEGYRILHYNGRYYPTYHDGHQEYVLDRRGLYAGHVSHDAPYYGHGGDLPWFGTAWRPIWSYYGRDKAVRFCWRLDAQEPDLAARRWADMAIHAAYLLQREVAAILGTNPGPTPHTLRS